MVPTATLTFTTEWTSTSRSLSWSTSTYTTSYATDILDNGFVIGTTTLASTVTSYDISTIGGPSDFVSTWVSTATSYTEESITLVPSPTCSLPSVVSQCQSSVEGWVSRLISAAEQPYSVVCTSYDMGARSSLTGCELATTTISVGELPCSQASIGGTLCESLRTLWQQGRAGPLSVSISLPMGDRPEQVYTVRGGSIGYLTQYATGNGYAQSVVTWSWPATKTIVPGCSV